MTEGDSAKILSLVKLVLLKAARVALVFRVPVIVFERLAKEAAFEALRRKSGMMPIADVYTVLNQEPIQSRRMLADIREDGTFPLTPQIEEHLARQACRRILTTWQTRFHDPTTGAPKVLKKRRQGQPTMRSVIETAGLNSNVGPVMRELSRFGCIEEKEDGFHFVHDRFGLPSAAEKWDLDQLAADSSKALDELFARIDQELDQHLAEKPKLIEFPLQKK